jgi:predicted nucleotidyltransferase
MYSLPDPIQTFEYSRFKFNFHDREPVFAALRGSRNYNLARPDSDYDFLAFAYPSLEDLYYEKRINYNYVSDDYDYVVHDIRKLPDFIYKGSYSFVELLFSNYFIANAKDPISRNLIQYLKNNRFEFITMNPKGLYKSAMGSAIDKFNHLSHISPATCDNVNKYEYDPKQAVHCLRLYLLMIRYAETNDYESSLQLKGKDQELLMNIYYNPPSLKSITETILGFMKHAEALNSYYINMQENKELYNELKNTVKSHVFAKLFNKKEKISLKETN